MEDWTITRPINLIHMSHCSSTVSVQKDYIPSQNMSETSIGVQLQCFCLRPHDLSQLCNWTGIKRTKNLKKATFYTQLRYSTVAGMRWKRWIIKYFRAFAWESV